RGGSGALRTAGVHRAADLSCRRRHAQHSGDQNLMADFSFSLSIGAGPGTKKTLLRSFRFLVSLRKSPAAQSGSQVVSNSPTGAPLGDGGFQECSGLEVEMDVQEYQEGGRNDGIIRRAGRAKYSNIVLKRGMFYGTSGGVNRDL